MTADLKARALAAIDAVADDACELARVIFREPELGFKEHRTAARVREWFDRLGLPHVDGLAITGTKAILRGARPGPTVAILGELDSLLNWEHPDHDPATGAVHACGHNCQVAMMVAAAAGLRAVAEDLAGRVAFVAVPAEEYVELEERYGLYREGKLGVLSGKGELVRLGAFDDIDIAMMVHATARTDQGDLGAGSTANGMVAKFVRYLGHTTHAGGQPDRGVNALYAAHVALAGINALRETFRDDDHVRVHPIITRGGDVVNAIPGDVRLELFCRAASVEAIEQTHRKVDRALKAGALALGAAVEITTLPGYLPLFQDPHLCEIFLANGAELVGRENARYSSYAGGGSTDMGDLAHIMPALHPYAAGATGTGHGADFAIADYEKSVVTPAKALAMTVIDLLAGDAATANEVLADFQPRMTKAEYLDYVARLTHTKTFRAEDLEGDP